MDAIVAERARPARRSLRRLTRIRDDVGMLPASLQLPAFRRLLAASTMSTLGSLMTFIVLPIVVWEETGSGSAFAFVMAGGAIGMILAMPFGGVIADRYDRRRILLVGNVASLLIASVMFAAVEASAWWLLPFIELAATFLGSLFVSAGPALRREALTDDVRTQGTALFSAGMSAANLLGPLIGTAIYAAAGFGVVIAIDIATFAISFLLILGVRGIRTRAPRDEPNDTADGPIRLVMRDIRDGVSVVRRDGFLARMLAGNFVSGLANGMLLVSVVPWLDAALGLPTTMWGTLIAAMGGASLVGSLVMARTGERIPSHVMMTAGSATFVLGAACLLGTPSVPRLFFGFVVIGFVNAMYAVGVNTLVQRRVSATFQGRVGSLTMCVTQAAQLISVLVAGFMLEPVSPRVTMSIAVALFCTAAFIWWRSAVASRTMAAAFSDEELALSA
jgi:MFS family permease